MAIRRLTDWIASYLDYTADQESPEKMHFWTALSVISGAMGRRCWMNRGTYTLYPNIYVCVVANSAKVRKSVAIGTGFDILQEAVPGLNYIEDRMTPEGLVKQLNRVNVSQNGANVVVSHDSTMFIYEDELTSLFSYDKSAAARMSTLLTATYGCKPRYMHTTAGGGQIQINNPCFTILGATAPEGLATIPVDASGGLLGRLILIASGNRRKSVAWPSPGKPVDRTNLVSDLQEVTKLSGEFTVTNDAKDFFKLWYEKQATINFKERWLEAFHERCHDTALKITMLLSASRSSDMVINAAHMEAGTKVIEDVIPGLKQVGIWLMPGDFAQSRARVEELIDKARTIRRADVMKVLRIPAKEMDEVEQTLEQEGYMKINIVGANKIYEKL